MSIVAPVSATTRNRVAVLHGVNFDILERRDAGTYGGISLSELEHQIADWAREAGLEPIFFQTNHEGEFVEYLHRLPDVADGVIVNAGAWSHYSRAIADALDVAALPAVEVHLSDIHAREDWRKVSVFDDLVADQIVGKGPDGYRDALGVLRRRAWGRGLMRDRGERLEALLAERELDRPPDHRPHQRPLSDRLRRHQRRPLSAAQVCASSSPISAIPSGPRPRSRAGSRSPSPATGSPASPTTSRAGSASRTTTCRSARSPNWRRSSATVPRRWRPGALVERLRRVKDAEELAAIAAASKLADEVWAWTTERGLVGRTEAEVALAAEDPDARARCRASFPTIVAAGPNGALPHAEPGERTIEAGQLVVFDMGAKLDGYCSDGTRTYATGDESALDDESRSVYETVLAAQAASLAAIQPGVKGEDVDAAARKVIDDAGHGDRFGHGLGHGVGLEVHEGPRLSLRSDDVLATDEVVTVEPGIYLPGKVGVRIEDLVVVAEDGFTNLSSLPKELTFVD